MYYQKTMTKRKKNSNWKLFQIENIRSGTDEEQVMNNEGREQVCVRVEAKK